MYMAYQCNGMAILKWISAQLPCIGTQMAILDGNAYDAKCLEAGQERDEDLEACSLLHNNKQQALLVPSGAAGHNAQAKVVVQLAVSSTCSLDNSNTCCSMSTLAASVPAVI